MAFEDTILLSIKREYTKYEKVSLLVQKLKELEFENGVLKSENAELEHSYNIANLRAKKAIKRCKEKGLEMELYSLNQFRRYFMAKKQNELMLWFMKDVINEKHFKEFKKLMAEKVSLFQSSCDRSISQQLKNKKL